MYGYVDLSTEEITEHIKVISNAIINKCNLSSTGKRCLQYSRTVSRRLNHRIKNCDYTAIELTSNQCDNFEVFMKHSTIVMAQGAEVIYPLLLDKELYIIEPVKDTFFDSLIGINNKATIITETKSIDCEKARNRLKCQKDHYKNKDLDSLSLLLLEKSVF